MNISFIVPICSSPAKQFHRVEIMGVVLNISLVGLALYLVGRIVWRAAPRPFPPGPPGWPLIGNLFDLQTYAPYKTLGAMSSKYGKCTHTIHILRIADSITGHIISLRVLGTQLIFLNSLKTTKDLLEKKSAITANRPHHTVAGDLIGWGNVTALLQYGDKLRKHRKFFARHINTNSNLVMFFPTEEAAARRFVLDVSRNHDDLIVQCRRCC